MPAHKTQWGFTIVETLLALFIGSVLMLAAYGTMTSGQKSSAGVERKLAAQQDARAALEIMAVEIQMASYNPLLVPGIWRDPYRRFGNEECRNEGHQELKGIQEATAYSIIVEMDIGESGGIHDNHNEIIQYVYDAANQYITRTVSCGGADPFLGDKPDKARSLRVVNDIDGNIAFTDNIDIPVFRYFDATGNLLPFSTEGKLSGDNIKRIRRIDITFAVETEQPDPSTRQRRRMIYSTSVIPRNHAINL